MKNIDITIILLGPAVLGLIVGLEQDPVAAAQSAAAIPAMIAVVSGLMLPALYIGMSMVGDAPPARQLGRSVAHAAQSCGYALIGMAIPVAFLLATTRAPGLAGAVGGGALVVGVFCGLRVLRDGALGETPEPAGWWIYNVWSITALGIGARFYTSAMPKGI